MTQFGRTSDGHLVCEGCSEEDEVWAPLPVVQALLSDEIDWECSRCGLEVNEETVDAGEVLTEADVDAEEIIAELEEEEQEEEAVASLFGYEWSFTCECGQTVSLSGLSTHPRPDGREAYSEYDALSGRIRSIEGTRTFRCPNNDCDRELEIGITVTNDD